MPLWGFFFGILTFLGDTCIAHIFLNVQMKVIDINGIFK